MANQVAQLQSALASLTARVAALGGAGTGTTLCVDLTAVPLFGSNYLVGRVSLSAVPQGNHGFHRLVGAAINWAFSYATPPIIFDPLYGSAFVASDGNVTFGFFVATDGVKYQEVRGTLNGPLFQTGAFSLRTTDDPPANQDIIGTIAAATCPAFPQ